MLLFLFALNKLLCHLTAEARETFTLWLFPLIFLSSFRFSSEYCCCLCRHGFFYVFRKIIDDALFLCVPGGPEYLGRKGKKICQDRERDWIVGLEKFFFSLLDSFFSVVWNPFNSTKLFFAFELLNCLQHFGWMFEIQREKWLEDIRMCA